MRKTFKCHLDRTMRLSCVAELIPRIGKNHEFELLFSIALHLFIIADDVIQSLTNPLDFIFSITGPITFHHFQRKSTDRYLKTHLVSRPQSVNFVSQLVLHLPIKSEMITCKCQSGTGSLVTTKKKHKTLSLNIFIVNFLSTAFFFCVKH